MSDLEPNAQFGGYGVARAGPIWFSAFGQAKTGKAVVSGYTEGHPTKVVIHPDPGTHTELTVRGVDCVNGRPLHFCYSGAGCGVSDQAVSAADLERMGDAAVTIAAGDHSDATGYMLFPRRGMYKVWVEHENSVLGFVVLEVA